MNSHNTLLKKIILLFICIFIPLTITSMITINYSNQKLKNQLLSSIDSNNNNYILQLNTSLDNIYINGYNLINQSNFRNFSNIFEDFSTYDKRTQVKLIQEQLSGLKIANPLIDSAHVYFFNIGMAFHNYGYNYGSFHHLSSKDLQLLKNLNANKMLSYYYQNPTMDHHSLEFFISPEFSDNYRAGVTISKSELEKYLSKNEVYDGEGYFFYSNTAFSIENLPNTVEEGISEIQKKLKNKGQSHLFFRTTLSGIDYYAFSYEIPSLTANYVRLIPTEALLKNINTAPILITIFLCFILLACILFFIGVYRLIHKPLHQLTTAFEELEEGDFSTTISDMHNADFSYLFQAFNNMTTNLNLLIEKDYNQQMFLQKAELKQLQAQINPHFLYNSFFMLQRMIKMDLSEESQEMASALGSYFRYLTRNSMDTVTLETEYEHAKIYAYIQGLRFSNRIEIQFDSLPDDFKNLFVPKLILQPLLENGFDYGLQNKLSNGLLRMSFIYSEENLTVIVEDNGEDLTEDLLQKLQNQLDEAKETSTNYEMTALLNIQRRLTIFSNYTDSLTLSRSDLGGLRVAIHLQKSL